MEDEDPLLSSAKRTLEAQLEIKQQLLKEIARVEEEQRSRKSGSRTAHFFSSSLMYAVAAKNSVVEQIERCTKSVLPETRREYERVHERRLAVEERIRSLREKRNSKMIQELKNPEMRHDVVSWLVNSLNHEIQELTAKEKELQAETGKAREQLRELQQANIVNQRASAIKHWGEEVQAESDLRGKGFRRKRSLTVGRGTNSVTLTRRQSLRPRSEPRTMDNTI
jgi:uncharacterized coiled-coil DUF342 family protein